MCVSWWSTFNQICSHSFAQYDLVIELIRPFFHCVMLFPPSSSRIVVVIFIHFVSRHHYRESFSRRTRQKSTTICAKTLHACCYYCSGRCYYGCAWGEKKAQRTKRGGMRSPSPPPYLPPSLPPSLIQLISCARINKRSLAAIKCTIISPIRAKDHNWE